MVIFSDDLFSDTLIFCISDKSFVVYLKVNLHHLNINGLKKYFFLVIHSFFLMRAFSFLRTRGWKIPKIYPELKNMLRKYRGWGKVKNSFSAYMHCTTSRKYFVSRLILVSATSPLVLCMYNFVSKSFLYMNKAYLCFRLVCQGLDEWKLTKIINLHSILTIMFKNI